MINKNKILKEKCTGCCACVNICPQNAIEMKINEEGFYFPVVDEKKCTRCGLCLGVCPVLNENDSRNKSPKEVYACRSLDRANQIASSSGGIFSELSNKILDRGGVVFGAAFKEGEVKHISIEKKEDLYLLKGSKYLQSSVGNSFQKALSFLKEGRMVFFSGTPCQIAGLRSFMKKKEADTSCLFCVDLVCHGVPSYRLFQDHIRKISEGKTLKNVYFRDKRFGWKNFFLVYVFEDGTTKKIHFQRDLFMRGFLYNYCLRRSCYDCLFSRIPRQGDVTLGDFWGIPKKNYDYYGVSAVLLNSEKGERLFEEIKKTISFNKLDVAVAFKNNPRFEGGSYEKDKREVFFEDYFKNGYEYVAKKYLKPNLIKLLAIYLRTIKSIFLKK